MSKLKIRTRFEFIDRGRIRVDRDIEREPAENTAFIGGIYDQILILLWLRFVVETAKFRCVNSYPGSYGTTVRQRYMLEMTFVG